MTASDNDMTFEEYLDAAMKRQGYTAKSLARATKIDPSLIGRWRAGTVKPTLDSLKRVAAVLDVPVMDLVVTAGLLTPEQAARKDADGATATARERFVDDLRSLGLSDETVARGAARWDEEMRRGRDIALNDAIVEGRRRGEIA